MNTLQVANIGLDMDPEVATYVGMLEGTIAALSIQACQNRMLLELMTGDGWQAGLIEMTPEALQEFATQALVKQAGLPIAKAKLIVAQRWENQVLEKKTLVPQAISLEEYSDGEATPKMARFAVVDVEEDLNPGKSPVKSPSAMSQRLQDWRAKQVAAAEEI